MPDDRTDRSLTADERKAIASLERVAAKWPKSLTLMSAAGSFVVLDSERHRTMDDRLSEDDVLANIYGIPNDGGDPW